MADFIVRDSIEEKILVLRGLRVMLDHDLAALYGVPTKRFNEQVKRNSVRFPADFMFVLTEEEARNLRSQTATSKEPMGRGGRRYLPRAFTEHGAIMAASMLSSPRAVEMSVLVVRAFVRLRDSHQELSRRLDELERQYLAQDKQLVILFDSIRDLMEAPAPAERRIGFRDP